MSEFILRSGKPAIKNGTRVFTFLDPTTKIPGTIVGLSHDDPTVPHYIVAFDKQFLNEQGELNDVWPYSAASIPISMFELLTPPIEE